MSSSYINKIIQSGEGQQLDFKFEISDSKKIARTLSAFANTDGGKLLIGVKDNGVVSGIRTDEEYYMLEAAASMYCKPEVNFKVTNHNIEGKLVMEVEIGKSDNKPHFSLNEDGKWVAYIRKSDQNLLANKVILKIWKKEKRTKGLYFKYSEKEKILLDYLKENQQISLSRFCKLAVIKRNIAENILVNLILLNIIEMHIDDKQTIYKLVPVVDIENTIKKSYH